MTWSSLRPYVSGAAISALLMVGAGIAVITLRQGPPPTSAAHQASTANASAATRSASPVRSQAPPSATDPVAQDITLLRTVSPVAASSREALIGGDAASQPDLYAAEFVRRLLTEDFRKPRAEHLAWVQAESAQTSEPLVVGLVPRDLRDRLAVYSVTEASGQEPAVPSAKSWASLAVQQAYTTVHIDHVEEPMAWSTAVSSGRISDPGITGREVSATVTLHYLKAGRPVSSTSSIDMTLNLEGPPTRSSWAFVTAVTYSSLSLSAS